ncbi:MAG: hypothetical protein WBO84_13270, partial [Acidimicrobiia bacterium]
VSLAGRTPYPPDRHPHLPGGSPEDLKQRVAVPGRVADRSTRERVEMLWPSFGAAGPLRRAGYERDT